MSSRTTGRFTNLIVFFWKKGVFFGGRGSLRESIDQNNDGAVKLWSEQVMVVGAMKKREVEREPRTLLYILASTLTISQLAMLRLDICSNYKFIFVTSIYWVGRVHRYMSAFLSTYPYVWLRLATNSLFIWKIGNTFVVVKFSIALLSFRHFSLIYSHTIRYCSLLCDLKKPSYLFFCTQLFTCPW